MPIAGIVPVKSFDRAGTRYTINSVVIGPVLDPVVSVSVRYTAGVVDWHIPEGTIWKALLQVLYQVLSYENSRVPCGWQGRVSDNYFVLTNMYLVENIVP